MQAKSTVHSPRETPQLLDVDLCVYGGTSGGVVAAIAAKQQGRTVVLIEPGRHLGGMTSGGLGLTDHGCKEAIGGLSREFYQRLAEYYSQSGSPLTDHELGLGWTHEPHVAENIFNDWISENNIPVVFEHRVASGVVQNGRLHSITLDHAPPDERGAPTAAPLRSDAMRIQASLFIDASYEGDLMACAGVGYTRQRESREQYGESLAGVRFKPYGVLVNPYLRAGEPESGLLPLIQAGCGGREGDASDEIQAYNFRLCLSKENMRPMAPPENYDSLRYEIFGREICAHAGQRNPLLPRQFYHPPVGHPWVHPRMLKMSPMPGGKTDVNNCGGSTDFIGGGSTLYPEANWADRAKIWHDHEDYIRGLFHFLRTDKRVLPETRTEVAKWGLPEDEFQDSGGWPHQLYVRESRRMLGEYVMTQADCERPTLSDSIGMGSYALDSHMCQRLAADGQVIFEGGFFFLLPGPYPIAYKSLCPRRDECQNLLVIFCLSSSHAAYSSLRMEPVLMILGQSAAVAACEAIEQQTPVQDIDVPLLQRRLRAAGQILECPDAIE